jgi:hypothetical protein
MKRSGRHDVRRGAQQHLALVQRLAHQPELILLEVAQARRGSAWTRPSWCGSPDRPARPAAPTIRARRVARDRRPVDPAADDEEVEVSATFPITVHAELVEALLSFRDKEGQAFDKLRLRSREE